LLASNKEHPMRQLRIRRSVTRRHLDAPDLRTPSGRLLRF
jgi:hypothetical protein